MYNKEKLFTDIVLTCFHIDKSAKINLNKIHKKTCSTLVKLFRIVRVILFIINANIKYRNNLLHKNTNRELSTVHLHGVDVIDMQIHN